MKIPALVLEANMKPQNHISKQTEAE